MVRYPGRFGAAACLATLLLLSGAPEGRAGEDRLTEKEARARFEEILPSEQEMGWARIPWRKTMLEAVVEANAQDKPILLYQMRGHPLGAT